MLDCSASVRIVYRHIGTNLFWGFEEKRTRRGSYKIAEREKALLDWVYLQRQGGLPVALDELSLKSVDKKKLQKYALRYPNSVKRTMQKLICAKVLLPRDADTHSTALPYHSSSIRRAIQLGQKCPTIHHQGCFFLSQELGAGGINSKEDVS